MTTAQKIIKYLAIALAIFLIVAIISAIMGVLYGFSNILGLEKQNDEISNNEELKLRKIENSNIKELNLDIAYADLKIIVGEALYLETNSEKIECEESAEKVIIKEEKNNWFKKEQNKHINLYIPENLNLDKIQIKAGAGKITIENIKTKTLDMELGAGETTIKNIKVADLCDIDSGAGKFSLTSSEINNLDFDMGVGEANINAKLTGKSDIDAGVGSLNISLVGKKEDYKIEVDKGIGNINIDGENVSNNTIYGNGESFIDIDGGLGSIKIEFINEDK